MTDLRFLTAAAAARELHISRDKLRRYTASGEVPFVRDPESGRALYTLTALTAWQRRMGELAAERAS